MKLPQKSGGGTSCTHRLNNVLLRKIEISDTPNIVRWRNTESVKRNLYSQNDLTEEQHLWWLENKVKTGECSQYIINIDDTKEHCDIGTVFIKNIDMQQQKGEFGIQIGEDKFRGMGYGKEAACQMLAIAFNELHLNRVYLSVLKSNVSAIKSYLNAGFLKEGILKEDYFRDGVFYDVIVMAITKNDWKNSSLN